MAVEQNRANDERFVRRQHYIFDPPVLTKCIAACGGQWEEKRFFAKGMCLKFEPSRNAYVFQGKPVDESGERYFFLELGKGNFAKRVSPHSLRVAE